MWHKLAPMRQQGENLDFGLYEGIVERYPLENI